jgi:hypothetical protein
VGVLAPLVLVAAHEGGAASQDAPVAVPASGGTPEAHLDKGYDALKHDMYEAAVSEFRAAFQLDPSLVLQERFSLSKNPAN